MKTTPKTIPAADVVGGLWDGALVFARDMGRCRAWSGSWYSKAGGGINSDRGARHSLFDPSTLVLRLDDPLGLGLAGLAARVAERLPHGNDDALLDGCPGLGRGVGPFDSPEALVAASTYLARTDRLCAAVGLRLEPGEVAGWECHGDSWILSTRDGMHLFEEGGDIWEHCKACDSSVPADAAGRFDVCPSCARDTLITTFGPDQRDRWDSGERYDDESVLGQCDVDGTYTMMPDLFADITDPLDALAAALREVEGG